MSVHVAGSERLRAKLRDPEKQLLGEPWRKAMGAFGEVAQNALAGEGPVGPSGRTVAMLYHRVQAVEVPLWIRVGTRAKQASARYPGGYPYPKPVNYAPRSPRRGWFERGIARARSLLQPILSRAAQDIVARWGR